MKRIIWLFFIYSCWAQATKSDYTKNISTEIDISSIAGKTITLGEIWVQNPSVPGVPGDDTQLPCDYNDFLCAISGSRTVPTSYNGRPRGAHEWIKNDTVDLDINGVKFRLKIDYIALTYEYLLKNNSNGAYWTLIGTPGDAKYINSNNACGNIYGCFYDFKVRLNSGMIRVNLVVPSNVKSGTYYLNNVKIASLKSVFWPHNNQENYVHTEEASLFLNGSVTLPRRCSLSLSNTKINFSDVKTNQENGTLETKSVQLSSECIGIQNNVSLNVKLVPSSYTVFGGRVMGLAEDVTNSNLSALGIAASFTKAVNDCQNSDYTFNKEYLIGSANYSNNKFPTKNIYFSLCKYGVPIVGSFTGSVNVVARWTEQ